MVIRFLTLLLLHEITILKKETRNNLLTDFLTN